MSSSDFSTVHLHREQKKIADAIVKLLGPDASGGGCRAFYTPEEWRARGEEYGGDSILILVHDGGDLEPYCNWDYQAYELTGRLMQELGKLGCIVEQCTSWYSAVYPKPEV